MTDFNERAKHVAIQESKKANSIQREPCTNSDTDTSNRSFLIFNTPDPKPKSIKVFNIDADSKDDQSYEIVSSNNPEDFMKTSPLSPSRQHPTITASSTLEDKAEINTKDTIEFSVSTKKIDKATEEIYSLNSRKQDSETAQKADNITPQVKREIMYLDSSNSKNQTVDMTNNTPDIDQQTTHDPNIDMVIDQGMQFHMESDPTGTPVPDVKSLALAKNPKPTGNVEQLQMEKAYSPASSLTYKTPTS